MFRNSRILALSLALTCPVAVAACGGDDKPASSDSDASAAREATTSAAEAPPSSTATIDRATLDPEANENQSEGQRLLAQRVKARTADVRKQMRSLQKQIADGTVDKAAGEKQMRDLVVQLQTVAVEESADLERDGKLNERLKQQADAARKQIEDARQGQ